MQSEKRDLKRDPLQSPWKGSRLNSTLTYYRVDQKQIAFIKFVIEAYDNLALLSTLDRQRGLILMRIAPGCERVVARIMADIGENILVESIESDSILNQLIKI
jgi:hypothetical protein